MKTNWPREKERRECIRTAIWECRRKGFGWRAIADALKTTRWPVESAWHAQARRRGDSGCAHQWKSGQLRLLTDTYASLTCEKCGRIEYLNRENKWTEAKKGIVDYSPKTLRLCASVAKK